MAHQSCLHKDTYWVDSLALEVRKSMESKFTGLEKFGNYAKMSGKVWENIAFQS